MAELIWDGKYDKDGRRRAPVRLALPFQTVETVNESVQERQRSLELSGQTEDSEWRNRLIWGDKKYVLPALLPEFAGKVDLIYIDPPFDTGADFSFTTNVPGSPRDPTKTTEFEKAPSVIEQKAYRDTWGRGLDTYIAWLSDTVIHLYTLLGDSGMIFVHVGTEVSHYAKIVLDEIFGSDRFLNEIAWKRTPHAGSSKARSNKFPVNHESLLFYARGSNHRFQNQFVPYSPEYVARFTNPDKDPRGPWQAVALATYSKQTLDRLRADKMLIEPAREGAGFRYKWFLSKTKGKQVEDVWTDLGALNSMADERTGYPTQKPEALLERVVKASTVEGNLVLDCFAGSGTTAVAAEKLGRRWIACDLGRFAVHTTRKRLLGIPDVKPFVVQNLGKYERQAWQAAEFPAGEKGESERQAARDAAYRNFILELYHASPISGNAWLHGLKSGRMVHIGAVDAPVTISDVKAIAKEVWKSSTGAAASAAVDVLGWDFAFELNETAREIAAAARVDVRFKRIPRDALDKRAVEAGDVQFFELGALAVQHEVSGQTVTVKLADFVIPPDDVPEEARKAIKHWSQMIDYWAVDWDFKGDTFHNQWQAYRTRSNPGLELSAEHAYGSPGEYVILIKVIDILGNDTTKALAVRVSAPKQKGTGA